jgi:hypothetical protein
MPRTDTPPSNTTPPNPPDELHVILMRFRNAIAQDRDRLYKTRQVDITAVKSAHDEAKAALQSYVEREALKSQAKMFNRIFGDSGNINDPVQGTREVLHNLNKERERIVTELQAALNKEKHN